MKYATTVSEIPNAFPPDPLVGDELDKFYDDKTMLVRTGDEYDSPIADIYDHCTEPELEKAMLLLGHKGCGKSTELNKMEEQLIKEGYKVKNIDCWNMVDMSSVEYTDLLILLGDALIDIAYEIDCDLPEDIRTGIFNFWRYKGEEIIADESEYALLPDFGISVGTPSISDIVKVLFNVKANIKLSYDKRRQYKRQIERPSSGWMNLLRQLAYTIAEKLDGKYPVVIFEDLDKLDGVSPEKAWDIFSIHGAQLSSYPFPVVYTFPISLSYDPRFHAVESYFKHFIMPMIKLRDINGEPTKGKETIRKIVEIRADLSLFDDKALDLAIRKTGGSLRDLFNVIRTAATYARRGKKEKIEEDMVDRALEKIKSDITRRIEGEQHDFLMGIYNGKHTKIENKQMLLQMMQANAVLEYNGKRWHDVHPLVADYLIDDLHMTERRKNDR